MNALESEHRRYIKANWPNAATNIGWGTSSDGIASLVEGVGVVESELNLDGTVTHRVRDDRPLRATG